MKTVLKVYAGDGVTFLGELPDFKEIQPMVTLNDVGAISFAYPFKGVRADQIARDEEREVAIVIDGVEQVRYLIEEDGRDKVDEDMQKAILSVSGREVSQLLADGIVLPVNGVGTVPTSHPFVESTPGFIFDTLFGLAQGRGALTGWTLAFDATNDSAGQPWANLVTFDYKAGASLLDVIKHLANTLGVLDWRVVGREIRAYNPGTFMAQDKPNAVFMRGRDFQTSPIQRSKRDIMTAVFVEGDNGKAVFREDAPAIALRGRKEGYFTQGGVEDTGTLSVIGDLQLSVKSKPKYASPTTVVFTPQTPKPFTDYNIGDYVYTERTGQTPEQKRLMRMSLTIRPNAITKGELDLDGIFETREIQIERLLSGAMGGIGSGTSTPVITQPEEDEDFALPSQPGPVQYDSYHYFDANGFSSTTLHATFPAVTTRQDGSQFTDLAGYVLEWRLLERAEDWHVSGMTKATEISVSPIPANTSLRVRVGVVNKAGDIVYSDDISYDTSMDTTPPPVPSAPAVDSTTFFSTNIVTWDGNDATGVDMAPDFSHLEVHSGAAAAFVPDASTRVGDLFAAGTVPVLVPKNVDRTFKFVAVDRRGNKSAASAGTTANNSRLLGDVDLTAALNGEIDSAKSDAATALQAASGAQATADGKGRAWYQGSSPVATSTYDIWYNTNNGWQPHRWTGSAWEAFGFGNAAIGSLDAGKITSGYINSARIDAQSISADKIGAGTLSAGFIHLTGTMSTAPNGSTGARVNYSGGGFHAYDGGNNLKFALNSDGSAIFNGTIEAGVVGGNLETKPGPNNEKIRFTSVNGALVFFYSGASGEDYPGYLWVNTDSFGIGQVSLYSPRMGSDSNNYRSYIILKSSNASGTLVGGMTYNALGHTFTGPNGAVVQVNNDSEFPAVSPKKAPFWIGGPGTATGDYKMAFDRRKIQAYNDIYPDTLHLNFEGGTTYMGGDVNIQPSTNGGEGLLLHGPKYTPSRTNFWRASSGNVKFGVASILNIQDTGGSAYRQVGASAFVVNSEKKRKTAITDLPFSAIEALRKAKSSQWKRDTDRPEDPLHIGPMLEDLPPMMKHKMGEDDDFPDGEVAPEGYAIDSAVGLLWEALRELDAELDELRDKLKVGKPVRV